MCDAVIRADAAATVVRPSNKYFQCWVIAFAYMFDFSEHFPETFRHFFSFNRLLRCDYLGLRKMYDFFIILFLI